MLGMGFRRRLSSPGTPSTNIVRRSGRWWQTGGFSWMDVILSLFLREAIGHASLESGHVFVRFLLLQ